MLAFLLLCDLLLHSSAASCWKTFVSYLSCTIGRFVANGWKFVCILLTSLDIGWHGGLWLWSGTLAWPEILDSENGWLVSCDG